VTKKVKTDPTACEDFFVLVTECHVLELVTNKFNLASLDSTPSDDHKLFGTHFRKLGKKERSEVFQKAIKEIIYEYTHGFEVEQKNRQLTTSDRVLAYSTEVLTLGLLFMEFCDAIREGDGIRIVRCWRFMLLLFKAKAKRKYAVQAATMLLQYHYLFTERMKHQLLWSRTINVHGRIGRNIPMDLHLEHLNRELKCAISHLGANVAEQTIMRVGYCLRQLIEIKQSYDKCTGIPVESGFHTSLSLVTDINLVLEELKKADVFTDIPKRKHRQFKSFKCNAAAALKKGDLKLWLNEVLKRLIRQE
jgi:L1 cell adhesion molecule like protein